MTEAELVRHAQTIWNRAGRIQGQEDSPLTPAGREAARSWGRRLAGEDWDLILASDLGRARETAALINETLALDVHLEPGLREMDWGEWTGLTFEQIQTRYPGRLEEKVRSGWDFRPPGGEGRRELFRRASESLTRAAGVFPGARILVVTHEGLIKALLYRLSGRRYLPEEPKLIKSGYMHRLELTPEGPRLGLVNALDLNPQPEPE